MKSTSILTVLLLLVLCKDASAQTGDFSLLRFHNHYLNEITTGLYTANPRSGFIMQTDGSINFGLKGYLPNSFMFRWLAHHNGDVDYTTDQDLQMSLDGFGNLKVKSRVEAPDVVATGSLDYSHIYMNRIRPVVFSANFRSGTIMESGASINFGMTGPKATGFRFRWLVHDNGAVNYEGDEDVIMSLDPHGLLQLKGHLHAKKIKITQEIWPDYVFEPDYSLPTLAEVESHIKQHRHLPGIPSAATIQQQGLDVGEQQAALLKKVEELTLYMIDLNKKLEVQQQVISAQQQEIKQQRLLISALRP